jgi:hypothetical protein
MTTALSLRLVSFYRKQETAALVLLAVPTRSAMTRSHAPQSFIYDQEHFPFFSSSSSFPSQQSHELT